MDCKQILIAIVAGLITAPCQLAVRAAAEPAINNTAALPPLPDLDRWEKILDGLEPPPREAGQVLIRPVQQEPVLLGSFIHAAAAMPNWGGEALVVERGVHTLDQAAVAAGRPDLLLCRPDGCELRAPLLVNTGAGLVIVGSPEKPLRLRLHQETGAFVINTGILHIERASILGWSSSKQALAETNG
jgi:poly(beta-D-mannuronate) C5 epimerase